VRFLLWTDQARDDLAAIHAFISQDSPDYASVIVAKLIAAAERLRAFQSPAGPSLSLRIHLCAK